MFTYFYSVIRDVLFQILLNVYVLIKEKIYR